MLYEVITMQNLISSDYMDAQTFSLEWYDNRDEIMKLYDAFRDLNRSVITSYSIHYTKLYETSRALGDIRMLTSMRISVKFWDFTDWLVQDGPRLCVAFSDWTRAIPGTCI